VLDIFCGTSGHQISYAYLLDSTRALTLSIVVRCKRSPITCHFLRT